MFNIVKHRDFTLADDVPTWRLAEELRLQKYGLEFIVVVRADIDPACHRRSSPIMGSTARLKPRFNRHVERVLNASRKDTHWGKRKLKREV